MADVITLIRTVESLSTELTTSTSRLKQLQSEYLPLIKENESLHRELKRFSSQSNPSALSSSHDVQSDSNDSDKLQQLWRQSLAEVERLTEELSRERRKYRPMDIQIKEINDRHERAQQQHLANISRLENDLQSLKLHNSDLIAKVKQDKFRIESLNEDISEKADAIAKLEQNEFRLTSELSKLRSVASRNESLMNENQHLLTVHNEYEDLKRKLEAQERIFFERLNQVTNILDSCFSDRDQAVLTLQSEQEKRQSLQGEFEKLMSSEANKFAEKIKTLELMKTMEVESLRKEISQLNKEVTMLRSDSHLREQDHREKCRELELVADSLTAENQQTHNELKAANLRIDRVQQERDAAQIKLEEVQVELRAKLHRYIR